MRRFKAALSIKTKEWKQPSCPSSGEWETKYGPFIQWNILHQYKGMKDGPCYNTDLPVTPGCRGRSDIHCERGPGCSRHCCSDPPPEPQSSLSSWSQPGKKESELNSSLPLSVSNHLLPLKLPAKDRKNKTSHHEMKENLRDPQTSQVKKKGTNISHWWTLLPALVLLPLYSWLLFYQQKWGGRKESIGHDRPGTGMLGRGTRRETRDPLIAFGQQTAKVTLCTSMNMLPHPQPRVN